MGTDEIRMPDGRPMHEPCGCEECRPGPGINYAASHFSSVLRQAEEQRTARIERLRRWREENGEPMPLKQITQRKQD